MDFVIIANAWSAGADNPTSKHRIALELVRRGHRVLWLEGAGMRRPSLGSGRDRGRIARKLRQAFAGAQPVEATENHAGGGLWVVTPLLIPVPARAWVRRFNGVLYRTVARHWARRLRFADPVLINYVPVLAEAMRGWSGGRRASDVGRQEPDSRVVYHCVDRWDAFDMYDSRLMAAMDERCCRYADVVVATSQDLCDRCGRYNANVHLIMHGVDHAHFAQALEHAERPPDMPAGPVVGFFGLLSEWVDQELLIQLATALPEATFFLIGMADVDIGRLRGVRNIVLPGPKPFGELPAYIAHFAVGIIPFVVNELTRAVNPIKLREMLAAGCPVVSTELPEVARYAGGAAGKGGDRPVCIAHAHDAFIAGVRARLERPLSPEDRRRLSASVAGETWTAKVGEMLEAIGCR